jgi:hypothetical protein
MATGNLPFLTPSFYVLAYLFPALHRGLTLIKR